MITLSPHLLGYGLTTAFILYRIPDFQRILQTFVWQDYDMEPRFPMLHAFLDFWESNLDGKLFAVNVMHRRLISEDDFKSAVN